MQIKECINYLNDFFTTKKNEIDFYYGTINEILKSSFELNEDDFRVESFLDSLKLIGGESFSEAIYTLILFYDDKNMSDELDKLEDKQNKHLLLKIASIYGQRFEKLFYIQNMPKAIKQIKVSMIKNIEWNMQMSISTNDGDKISVCDTPNRYAYLCTEIIDMLKEMKRRKYISDNVLNDLKKALSNQK